jgi:hypothetical protein
MVYNFIVDFFNLRTRLLMKNPRRIFVHFFNGGTGMLVTVYRRLIHSSQGDDKSLVIRAIKGRDQVRDG